MAGFDKVASGIVSLDRALDHLRAGDNVLAFKVGAGSGGHALIALLSPERNDRGPSDADPELDAMTLYEDDIPGFDPYEFHYW